MKIIQVIWTQTSLNDLESIYDFIAERSPESAQKIIVNILSRTRQLESFPTSGTTFKTEFKTKKSYRYLVEGHFKIIYSVTKEAVYVEAVFDTRQNPEKQKF